LVELLIYLFTEYLFSALSLKEHQRSFLDHEFDEPDNKEMQKVNELLGISAIGTSAPDHKLN